jgi:DeoR/GlpR family transcriptional regulator of sugar metabolism
MGRVTDYHLEEANVRRKMIQKSELVILVADFQQNRVQYICSRVQPLHDFDIIITDWKRTILISCGPLRH